MKLSKKYIITFYIICFIALFFTFLYTTHILPEGYGAPIILLIGFGLLIAGFFYFFLYLIKDGENRIILRLNVFSENTITTILIILMICTFFIPSITFSETAIDWSQIPFLNFIRSIIFVIGCAFVPGSSIFCLLFPNSTIHERLKIEPFFIKIVFYPLISLTFLGTITLILDQLGTLRDWFSLILFLTIIILHLFKIIKFRRDIRIKHIFNKLEVKVSRNTLFMIFLTISIIIIALSIILHTRYLFGVDGYRAMVTFRFIGLPDIQITDISSIYTIYWGYITFSLSTLSGIPAINIMVLYFFLIYLSIASIYLFCKALLGDMNDKYAILATFFAIIFSSLYLIYENYVVFDRISYLTYDGIFSLRFKGFGVILAFASMTLFIIVFKNSNLSILERLRSTEDRLILFISAFLLIQGFIIYYLPIIPAISLICILMLVLTNMREQFKHYLYFSVFFICFFIFFNLIFNDLLSNSVMSFFSYFFGKLIIFPSNSLLKFTFTIISLIGIFASIPIISVIFNKFSSFYNNLKFKFKVNPKSIFVILIIISSGFLFLEISLNLIRTIRSQYYFTYILHLFYYRLGLTGILGVFLSYLCYKKNRKTFYITSIWFICLFIISLIPLLINWLSYPFLNPIEVPDFFPFLYWFSRTWYYSIIPISLLASIGLISLIKYLSSKFTIVRKKKRTFMTLKLISLSAFAFLIFSNSIIAGMFINNEPWQTLNDEEIQVIGWTSENLPRNSKILVDRRKIKSYLEPITTNNPYKINDEVEMAIASLNNYGISYNTDANCSIDYLEAHDNYEIDLFDNNTNGQVSVNINLLSEIRNGSIQFLLKTSNSSKTFWLNSSLSKDLIGFSLCLTNESFLYFNGSDDEKIVDIESDKWYDLKIDFECTNNNYSGLEKNQWKLTINGTEYGNYDFWNDVSFIYYLELFTSVLDSEWNVYITGLKFSWDLNVKLEQYIFRYLRVIEHLEKKKIFFFISSKRSTEWRTEVEEYIDIDNDLIPNFYTNKLYEYQDLAIYSYNV